MSNIRCYVYCSFNILNSMSTITIDISDVLFWIFTPFIIFYILYYRLMTTKHERLKFDTTDSFFAAVMLTIFSCILIWGIETFISIHKFIFQL